MAGSTHASPTVEAQAPKAAAGTPAPLAPITAVAAAPRRRVSPWADAWRRFRRHRLALAGIVILSVIIVLVVLGPFWWRVPINDIDFAATLAGPSWHHPFGTDDLGQDLLARVLYGGRISRGRGLPAMLVAVFVGTVIGALSGISRGWVDAGLMWLTDLFLSLPQLPLLLLIIYLFRDALKAVVGPELGVFVLIVVVIGGFRWMPVARLVRAQFFSLREKEFVEAARALGASQWRQVVHHMLPNALGPVIVAGTIEVAAAIIAEWTLSFLGLGFPPDIPSWGRLLFDAKDNLDVAPHWAIFPGAAIFLTVLTLNFVGDGLRDTLGPRKVMEPSGMPPRGSVCWKSAGCAPISRPTTASCTRSMASISTSRAARRWAWSASPAPANRSPPCRCSS